MDRCWLCENMTHKDVQTFHRFMVEKAHQVDTMEMAAHMHEHLTTLLGESAAMDQIIPTQEEIIRHVTRHVLHPTVRVAAILRNLLELSEMLRELVVSRAEDGTPLIDVRSVTVYLKVIDQIMNIYKGADMSRMLFAEMDK